MGEGLYSLNLLINFALCDIQSNMFNDIVRWQLIFDFAIDQLTHIRR